VEKCSRVAAATDNTMVHAHCMPDTQGYKYTHSEYVILNFLPLQQWLPDRALVLRYTYIVVARFCVLCLFVLKLLCASCVVDIALLV
jgi:hypothetical protein